MRRATVHRRWLPPFSTVLATLVVASIASPGPAGQLFRDRAVGGISINTDGLLEVAAPATLDAVRTKLRKDLQRVPEAAEQGARIRKVSMRQLEAGVAEALHHQRPIPDAVKYLAGIQRIEYVFVYPEQNDIVLAGPGEGWVVNDQGIVVGATNGQPVVLLDDLLIALRTVHAARQGGINCSIDPQPQGVARMQQLIRRQKAFTPQIADAVERAMGPQLITLQGIPQDTHFARVLVAADYRMKRIAMKLDQSPVKQLPSYLDMLRASRRGPTNAMPRWWLACNYESIAHGEDRLSWKLNGQGVKAMSEDELVDAQGNRQRLGKSSPLAQEWADTMTLRYEELASQDAVFGQLRNVMDLCVVAALLEKEDLYSRASCDLPLLRVNESELHPESWFAARQVDTQCSIVKRGREYIISASGGVQIGSWQVLDNTKVDASVDRLRSDSQRDADGAATNWWWN